MENMAAYSPEHRAQIARIRQVKAAHELRLLRLPGVNAVGLTLRTRQGAFVPEFALVVYVTEKKPLDQVPADERIPPEIDGVGTDVVVAGPFKLAVGLGTDENTYRPLRGGAAISADGRVYGRVARGTLGCVAFTTDPTITDPSKQFVLLTAAHVLLKPSDLQHNGSAVGQPDTCSVCCPCLDNTVSRLDHDGVLSGTPPQAPTTGFTGVDGGVATLDPGTQWLPEVTWGGEGKAITHQAITGTHLLDASTQLFSTPNQGDPEPLVKVHKRGARTRLTHGWVIDLDATVTTNTHDTPSDPPVPRVLVHQMMIKSDTAGVAFALEGDSGAAVLNDAFEVVALLHSTYADETNPNAPSYLLATASPITDVESQLKVKVADNKAFTGVQTVPKPVKLAGPATVADPPTAFLARRLADAEAELRATPRRNCARRRPETAWRGPRASTSPRSARSSPRTSASRPCGAASTAGSGWSRRSSACSTAGARSRRRSRDAASGTRSRRCSARSRGSAAPSWPATWIRSAGSCPRSPAARTTTCSS